MLYQISWALFFASMAWGLVMSQHAYFHGFTNKHFSIWYALVAGMCFPLYFERVKKAFGSDRDREGFSCGYNWL